MTYGVRLKIVLGGSRRSKKGDTRAQKGAERRKRAQKGAERRKKAQDLKIHPKRLKIVLKMPRCIFRFAFFCAFSIKRHFKAVGAQKGAERRKRSQAGQKTENGGGKSEFVFSDLNL